MDHWQPTTTGHSLDLQYWHDRQPIQVPLNTPTIRNSDILDQDFSWNQIAATLLQMSPRKAPGDDVFASATIPRAWLCASIVSIDKKDGDPLNPGDKRGIALINVGLKLVCKVLQMRIERFVETNNLLSYEQAGFRKREECVGQVVSLVDNHSAQTECWAKHPCIIHRYPKGIRYSPSWCTVMEAAEHGIPSSYSCLSQGIVHILICSSSGRITTIGPIPGTERCQTGMSIVWTSVQSSSSTTFSMVWHPSQSLDYRETRTPSEDSFNGELSISHILCSGYGQSLLWARTGWWQQVTPCNRYRQQSTRVSDCSLVPDSRLPLDPFWLKTGIGVTSHSLIGITRAVGKIPALVLVSSEPNSVQNKILAAPQVRPKTVKHDHSFALMENSSKHVETLHRSKSNVTRQLLDTSGFFKDPSFDQSRAHCTRYLILARMDALWTARKAFRLAYWSTPTHSQLTTAYYATSSYSAHPLPSRGGVVNKSPAIEFSRTSTSNSEITTQIAGSRTRSGVENVYTWLRGWSLKCEADLDQRLVGRDCGA
ncbi:hypothetical protein BASA83_000659 [Batrachochytrium salamandrivorans]|nr:hypothetical protein BASA83_000659 [Batrachochytrium salamandrivorans]